MSRGGKRKSGRRARQKNEPPGSNKQKTDPWKWVPRLVSHVSGGTTLVLPYAMSQAGIIPYIFFLLVEVYVIFESFVFFHEVRKNYQTSFGDKNANYFGIVKKCFHGGWETFAHRCSIWTFSFNILINTAYYLKITGELLESLFFHEPLSEPSRSGFFTASYISIACFVILFDHGAKRNKDGQQPDNAAEDEGTHTHTLGHSYLIFTIMCVIFVMASICLSLSEDTEVMTAPNATLCPGILQPVLYNGCGWQIVHAIPAIIFSLMNLVIILPLCTEVPRSPLHEYNRLIWKSRITLVALYTVLPLLAVYALGGSVPVLFPTAFGFTIYGQLLTFVSLVITLTALRLRIKAGRELFQELFLKWTYNSDDRYWVMLIFYFFVSFMISLLVRSPTHLVIISGSVDCNLLLIIIPRVAYIKFKKKGNAFQNFTLRNIWETRATWLSILWAGIVMVIHAVFLLSTPFVFYSIVDPLVRSQCREFFNHYWKTGNDYAGVLILGSIAKQMLDLSRRVGLQ